MVRPHSQEVSLRKPFPPKMQGAVETDKMTTIACLLRVRVQIQGSVCGGLDV